MAKAFDLVSTVMMFRDGADKPLTKFDQQAMAESLMTHSG